MVDLVVLWMGSLRELACWSAIFFNDTSDHRSFRENCFGSEKCWPPSVWQHPVVYSSHDRARLGTWKCSREDFAVRKSAGCMLLYPAAAADTEVMSPSPYRNFSVAGSLTVNCLSLFHIRHVYKLFSGTKNGNPLFGFFAVISSRQEKWNKRNWRCEKKKKNCCRLPLFRFWTWKITQVQKLAHVLLKKQELASPQFFVLLFTPIIAFLSFFITRRNDRKKAKMSTKSILEHFWVIYVIYQKPWKCVFSVNKRHIRY